MKKKISYLLIVLGVVIFSLAAEDAFVQALIGGILTAVGVQIVHERSNSMIAALLMGLATILGFGGGLASIIDWGFDLEYLSWTHVIIGVFVTVRCLGRFGSKEVPIATNDTALYKMYCNRLELPMGRLPLCFMARYDDTFIGIGSDDTIYSYYNNNGVRGVKKIAVSNIAGYEKFTMDDSVRVYIKVYTHGGSSYNYGFTMGEHQTFTECLDYLMSTPVNYESPNQIEERFNTACSISGIDPEIFNYSNLNM